ncbi:MAG: signal peptidase I [Patescibacteria group bacterium]
MKKILAGFLDVIEFFVSSSAIAIIIYLVVTQPHQVNGSSMYPNLHDGEFLLTDKFTYKFRNPQRGDIVVFAAPPQAHCPVGLNCDFIKRIIGMPGEKIKVERGQIYINGIKMSEPYENLVKGTGGGSSGNSFLAEGVERTIPEGQYVVMGDNRPGSSDSRDWGTIKKNAIVGKAWLRYWPPTVAGVLAFDKAKISN